MENKFIEHIHLDMNVISFAKRLNPCNYEDLISDSVLRILDRSDEITFETISEFRCYFYRVMKSIFVNDNKSVTSVFSKGNEVVDDYKFTCNDYNPESVLIEDEEKISLESLVVEMKSWLDERSDVPFCDYLRDRIVLYQLYLSGETYQSLHKSTKLGNEQLHRSVARTKNNLNKQFKEKHNGIINH